ncbi:TetR/AcrR family transcriptional regulator [Kordiimonas pumila]|uniref:TetR/AcrR family transcriptional regulator n=1 Tax=Kordiimonas pumila TaxID=2161677 RepID=A0ABV7D984_9PROT|nr:TetR/AcrR family transcriptional regulator [Kordiimonas pumila]
MTKKNQRRPSARPEEILDAALAVFTAKGFAASRMDEIAEKAGLTKGSVYLYFKSKEQLFEELITRFSKNFVGVMAERVGVMAEKDPEEALRTVIKTGIMMAADPAISAAPRLVLAEAARFPDMAAMYHKKVISVGQAAIVSLLQVGEQKGVFRAVQPDVAKRVIFGPVLTHILLTHTFGQKIQDLETLADSIAENILCGFRIKKDIS